MASAAKSNRELNAREELLMKEEESGELEIDLVALMYRLLEKAKWIVAAALLCTLLMGIFTANFITPLYESTAKLYVANTSSGTLDLTALNLGTSLANDYMQVFDNWHVHEAVRQRLGLNYSYKELGDMLATANPTSTRILSITVTSPDPQEAKDMAMTYAQVAVEFIAAKMNADKPTIFEEPRVPENPASPSMVKNLILGFLLGAVVAAAIIVVQFIADDRIRNSDRLEKQLGLATLGMMPVQEKKSKGKNTTKKGGEQK
ncbi:MAG: hypothetical protein IJ438_08615 [Clostridia bacterium]|nr:hypothetical protein [Clostridia bacterium]